MRLVGRWQCGWRAGRVGLRRRAAGDEGAADVCRWEHGESFELLFVGCGPVVLCGGVMWWKYIWRRCRGVVVSEARGVEVCGEGGMWWLYVEEVWRCGGERGDMRGEQHDVPGGVALSLDREG